jgi:hypothetical protein
MVARLGIEPLGVALDANLDRRIVRRSARNGDTNAHSTTSPASTISRATSPAPEEFIEVFVDRDRFALRAAGACGTAAGNRRASPESVADAVLAELRRRRILSG